MSIGSIYETAYKGDFNQVKVQVDKNKLAVSVPDTNSRLLIHWASLSGNENLVQYLIEAGSPVDPCDDTLSTPLIIAASAGRLEVIRLLIGKGANINNMTNRKQTSLHYACSKGHKEIVELLLRADADVNVRDVCGATPLHRAAALGRSDIVKILIDCPRTDINICDSTGSTALHLACEDDKDAVAYLLVKAGADLNITNKSGVKALDNCSEKLLNNVKRAMDQE